MEYTITQQDVEQGGVRNEAQLHYQYKSLHSAGQLATVSDAQASLTVQSSVQYQYESGTPGMQLPAALTALTPTDYTYYASGVSVPVQPHQVESPYWDEGNDGYWTLQNSGQWSDGATAYDPGSSFPMPSVPVTLTATWAFTKAPGIAIEKDGSFVQAPDADDVQALQQITYQVSYQLTVRNIGGESLNQFTISDRTLPDTLTSMTAKIGGSEIALEGVSCSANTWTFSLPDDGLPAGQELVLSYSCSRSGTLDSKKMLTDTSTATATARGVQSGVDVQDDTILSMYIVLEDRIMLMPADIVIYAGGDEDGSNVAPGTNLPEPGFFVTLPLEAEQKLRQVLNKQEQIDLSDYLTFSDSNQNVWGLEPFSGDYSKAHGSFLYRLVPKKVVDGQKKIEMQFYDEARHEYIQQSAFQITNALQQEYATTIYPGEIPAVNPPCSIGSRRARDRLIRPGGYAG